MPLYEYKCLKCSRRTEKIEPVNGPHLKKCPHCGSKVEALISASAIQFKGSGWYVTDYAGKKSSRRRSGDMQQRRKVRLDDKKDSASKDSTKDSGLQEVRQQRNVRMKETKESKRH